MHQPKLPVKKTITGKKENKKENFERAMNCHSSSFKKKTHALVKNDNKQRKKKENVQINK